MAWRAWLGHVGERAVSAWRWGHRGDRPDQPLPVDATILALSRTLGIARNTVHARLRRLAADGALKPFSQRFDLGALGYGLAAFMSLSVSQADPGLVAGLLAIPEVISAHYTTGDADILVHVAAKNPRDLYRITRAMLAIDGVARSSTVISLDEAIPYRPHALLRVAAGTRYPPGLRQSPEQTTQARTAV